jgi:hypothetical protein
MNKKKKKYFLKQCKIARRLDENAQDSKTTWLPEKFCRVGQKVTLKDEKHRNVWTVQTVGKERISSENIDDVKNAHREHRKTTDI